jgi:hypothetical protein
MKLTPSPHRVKIFKINISLIFVSETMPYEEIMESSVKKRTQNLLHEYWLSTIDQNELCQKIYRWLQKYFIRTAVRVLFTNNSTDEKTASLVRANS